jgi:hypothetical protein
MTVERTRQLLGSKVSHLTDEQVLRFISSTDKFLDVLLKQAVREVGIDKEQKKRLS